MSKENVTARKIADNPPFGDVWRAYLGDRPLEVMENTEAGALRAGRRELEIMAQAKRLREHWRGNER